MSLELHLFLLLLSYLSNGLLKSSELKKPILAPNGMARSSPENPTGFSTDNGLQGVFRGYRMFGCVWAEWDGVWYLLCCFLVIKEVVFSLTPGLYHSLWEVGWVMPEGPRLGRREGRIMMCLEQHFLSNSGIKIPRSRACDRHCWSWHYRWGGSAPCCQACSMDSHSLGPCQG